MVRWILSNPTYDSRYPKIIRTVRKVNALAPSSAGTPLADAVLNGNTFETSLGWLLGYKNDAVRQQQVASMATYNAQNLYGTAGRPALPKPFRAVVGSDVESAVWDSNSYCGGYAANVGLSSPRTGCPPAPMASGVQQPEGRRHHLVHRHAAHPGAEPLSHNQSRRECFGLGTLLRNDLTQ